MKLSTSFTVLIERRRLSVAAVASVTALALLDTALGLWRGDPLSISVQGALPALPVH